MKATMIRAHLDVATRYSLLSTARRLKVGALVVKDDRIISIGYNGTAPGDNNDCEDVEYTYDQRDIVGADWTYDETSKRWSRLKTKPEVIHAEENAIAKLARSHESGLGADMFITHAPCQQCAKMILQSGIRHVWYRENYKNTLGVEYLQRHGVECNQVHDNNQTSGV